MAHPSEYSASLPHEREVYAICNLAMDAYKTEDKKWLGIIIVDTFEIGRHFMGKLRDAMAWDAPRVKIFREGVEVDGGAKIQVCYWRNMEQARGMHPNKILLTGTAAEFWHFMRATGTTEIEVAR